MNRIYKSVGGILLFGCVIFGFSNNAQAATHSVSFIPCYYNYGIDSDTCLSFDTSDPVFDTVRGSGSINSYLHNIDTSSNHLLNQGSSNYGNRTLREWLFTFTTACTSACPWDNTSPTIGDNASIGYMLKNIGTPLPAGSYTYRQDASGTTAGTIEDFGPFYWNGNAVKKHTEQIDTDIVSNETWDKAVTYVISGNIEIDPGVTLTIDPGTIIKFDTATPSSLIVNGTLTAEGEEFSDIFFTSLKDDSLTMAGDTNGDGNTTSPAAGNWGGITVNSGGTATFKYATVRYAGLSGTSEAQIHNDGGTVTISNKSFVVHGTEYGIKNTDGTLNVSNTDIGFNDHGIYVEDGTVNLDGGNIIHDNSLYGVYNDTNVEIDAENNYWGHPTGPYHSLNFLGEGDEVSDYVEFNPWTTGLDYTNETRHPLCLPNNCTSVINDELLWKSSSAYSTELGDAITTWENLGEVDFINELSTPDLEIFDTPDRPDLFYKGEWNPFGPVDTLELNTYYLNAGTTTQIQHTITHELGHALGLAHSYTGNVMYHNQTSQIVPGPQDLTDYHDLWN